MPPTSSPLSSPPPSQQTPDVIHRVPAPSRPHHYRAPRPLPFELSQHVLIYFEETLYSQAFNLLISMLSSSAASTDPSTTAFVPSPVHLALAATLAIHPTFTTRTTSREKHEQANSALRLLRITNKIIGPIGADVNTAFSFTKFDFQTTRRRGGQQRRSDGDQSPNSPADGAEDTIDTPFSNTQSLYARADDFWHVVGWAFNCSCLRSHSLRWEIWSLWLSFMLHVLEDDWEIRHSSNDCDKSLIWQYIATSSGGHGANRRILRAIFADGGKTAGNEFREVFKNELKEPKSDAEKVKKREVDVNVEAEIYGDYMAKDDSSLDEDKTTLPDLRRKRSTRREPSSRRITPRNSGANLRGEFDTDGGDAESGPAALLGGVESLNLRLRLMHLLSNVAGSQPDPTTPYLTTSTKIDFLDLETLYTHLVEFIRPLPLPCFVLIVLPSTVPISTSTFSEAAHCSLCEKMLQFMLDNSAPDVGEQRFLTQAKLEKHYLPFAANKATVVDNAKVSLLLESMLRYFAMEGTLHVTPALKKAVELGIEARAERASSDSRNKGKQQDATVAWAWLEESGDRMRDIVNR